MQIRFHSIELAHQHAYQKRLTQCPYPTSDYSFINLWAWAEVYGLQWAWTDHLVWIRQQVPQKIYWAPVGDWEHTDWPHVFEGFSQTDAVIVRVPEALVDIWKKSLSPSLTALEDRDQWDYLYDAKELIELAGNRFHKKKNLLYQFKKNYVYQYLPLTAPMVEQAKIMQKDWCKWRECSSDTALASENQAIARILSAWDRLSGIRGGGLVVDGKMVAYTVGEKLTPQMLVIHFEKANPDYKGVYQAINQIFLSHEAEGMQWVNREQDMGDEGLRKAKLSYHPLRFLKKYRVSLNSLF